jgi:hypothetical protein
MAMLQFDASKVAPATGTPDLIPTAWYNAAMDESEMKPTRDATGQYLNCRFNIRDGQYAGRKVYSSLNLQNMNPTAVEIAYKELSAICHAAGKIQVNDSSDLHGIPMKIKVKLRAADPAKGYDASNVIAAYRNINDPAAVNPGQAPGGVAAPATPFIPPPQQPAMAAQPTAFAAAQQPWQQPQAAPPVQAPPPVAPATWSPPVGWTPHPSAPGYFYMGQEVLTEAQLKAKFAAPPAVPTAPPGLPAAPVAAAPVPQPWTAPPGVAQTASPQQAVPPWAQPTA